MPDLASLIRQSVGNTWLFVPTAILLGALHGLEPGHSKTMMAAFIIAVRGTVRQAVLLGLAATASHTLVVWAVALGGMWLVGRIDTGSTESWFQLGSGVLIVAIALWMLCRTRREQTRLDPHGHEHDYHRHHHDHHHHHDRDNDDPDEPGLDVALGGVMDAHERAHAADVRRRFADRNVSTGQIVLFGLTGGLIPCPGAITVLLLCLQVKRLVLGAALVLCFSIGLAITMAASGMIAAISVRQIAKRWTGFGELVRKAPYFSGGLILLVGLYVAIDGWMHLPNRWVP